MDRSIFNLGQSGFPSKYATVCFIQCTSSHDRENKSSRLCARTTTFFAMRRTMNKRRSKHTRRSNFVIPRFSIRQVGILNQRFYISVTLTHLRSECIPRPPPSRHNTTLLQGVCIAIDRGMFLHDDLGVLHEGHWW